MKLTQDSNFSLTVDTPILDAPNNDVLEIAVLGTGGGYGESIVIHLGERNWMVVDSCIDPSSNNILPIQYLEHIGVDIATEVKLVLCTHWHDDHIRGISRVLKKATSAKFSMARINDLNKFLFFVGLDSKKIKSHSSISSTNEFNECVDILKTRGTRPIYAYSDKLILASRLAEDTCEVFALSPSDRSIELFDSEISTLITNYGQSRKKVIAQTPNDKSVVLLVKFGQHRALLGADLEVSNSDDTGWKNILNSSQALDARCTYFKISHHGSENGYHTDIWTKMLGMHPVSTMTPWNKRDRLPSDEMIEKYKNHTPNLYITSSPSRNAGGAKRRDKQIEKIVDSWGYKIKEVRYTRGIIRSRIKINESIWKVALFDSAVKL